MKKACKLVGVAMTSVALLFASCSNDSISIETNATENPDVVAKAYPGYNYIAWSPVADGSVSNIVRDDGKKWISSWDGKDYDIEDGVEYRYTIYTKSSAANSTETKVGNKTSVTVKAIKPAIFDENGQQLHALDLACYESGTYKADASKDFIVSAENIKLNLDSNKERIFIQFPKKTYLTYDVKVYKGNGVELLPVSLSSSENITPVRAAIEKNKIKTDVTGVYYTDILGAGEYRVEVEVRAMNDDSKEYATNKIIAKQTVKIEAVDCKSHTWDVEARFTDKENKTVRVMWTPAKDMEANLYSVKDYTVYAYNNVTKDLTKVTGEISASKNDNYGESKDVYYVDTTTLGDRYAVVLSVNGKYEDISFWSVMSPDLVPYEEPDAISFISQAADFYNRDSTDSKQDDFVIMIYGIDKQKVSVKYFTYDPEFVDYGDSDDSKFSKLFVSADYVKEGIVKHVKLEYGAEYEECVISNVPAGQKVAYEITVTEEGKKDVVGAYISFRESND